MVRKWVGFTNLLVVSLIAGTVFGIWLGYDPSTLSPATYIEQQQEAIRALNVTMPVLGGIGILLTVASALFARRERRTLSMLVAATGCLILAALVTRFGNQPINAVVMTWSSHVPPPTWIALRDEWWNWHIARTCAVIVGLSLLILADPMGRR